MRHRNLLEKKSIPLIGTGERIATNPPYSTP
jgi:hypothetical protein